MANISFSFQIGEFVEVKLPNGVNRIGRIHNIGHNSVSLSWWIEAPIVRDDPELFFLPTHLVGTGEQDVIPLPTIGSIVFVFNVSDLSSYKVRFVHGMKNVFSTNIHLYKFSCQSVTHITFECISMISIELQRILSNRRSNQFVFSSVNLQISHLAWSYLVEKLGLVVHEKDKVYTQATVHSNDLAITRVKSKTRCKILRIDDRDSILRFIAIFGISAAVGVRKPLPSIPQKLGVDEENVKCRGGVQLKDVVNLVDVSSNALLPRPRRFSFNAQGRKGIDLVYIPDQSSLRICVRYSHFVVEKALQKLQDLGVGTSRNVQQLSDDELERLIRG
jgi:hypothetical protein